MPFRAFSKRRTHEKDNPHQHTSSQQRELGSVGSQSRHHLAHCASQITMRGDVLLLCLFCVSFRFTPVLSFKHKYTQCQCRAATYRLNYQFASPSTTWTSKAQLNNISSGTLPGHLFLTATSLNLPPSGSVVALKFDNHRPSVLHILSLGEELYHLQIVSIAL